MNTVKRYVTMAALISIGLSLSACSDENEQLVAPVQTTQANTLRIQPQNIPVHYTTSGAVASDHRVSISAQLSGYIQSMAVREGDKVKVGQLLLKIDPTDAKQALIQAKADLSDAEVDLKRFVALQSAGALSSQKVEKAQLRYDVAASHVARAENQLSYSEVRSPVHGVVVKKHLSIGDLASPGAPLLVIEDPQSLLVSTYVSESHVSQIHEGDNVDITIPSLNTTFEGTVRQVVQAADPVSHQFLVKVALAASIAIHPGMFAQAGFRVGQRQAILIPKQTIVSHSDLNAVYVVNKEGIAQYRLIRLGTETDDLVEVVSGLHALDTIAWAGKPDLKTGMKVQSTTHGQ